MPPPRPWLPVTAFLLLLALGAWAFARGLGGALIFDDIPNLAHWKVMGDISDGRDLMALATSGNGLPGRPLSLISFAIDDQSWPPDIAALKRTNLAIHLVNACLVFWLALRLLPHLLPARPVRSQAWLALFATAVWTLHPLQVSNVSYIIQRMNLLSTLFELTGLLLYLHGREQLTTRPWRALLLCSGAIGVFMPVAILAKENGLLLCAFALLIEAFCFPRPGPRWWPAWKALFLWLPLAAFTAYILKTFNFFMNPFTTRDFNAWERLLTQGPVLQDYLGKLLLPRLQGSGIYFDNFPVSRSLLSPPSTLLAWGLIAALLGAATALRRRLPLLSFGIFFYFVGHLMESTVLPLELYFEHRNYLPQLGLWLALAGLLAALPAPPRLQTVMVVSMVSLVLILAWMTRQNAQLWSQPQLQIAVWYQDNPDSVRTSTSYANELIKRRRLKEAYAVLEKAHTLHPNSLMMAINLAYVQCYLMDRPTGFDHLPPLARRAEYETASLDMLERMWEVAKEHHDRPTPPGACTPASPDQLAAIHRALLDNPSFRIGRTRAKLYSGLAEHARLRRDLDGTIHYYDLAFASAPNPLYPYGQALALANAGLPEPALEHLAKARGALTLRMRLIYPALSSNVDLLERASRQVLQQQGRHD